MLVLHDDAKCEYAYGPGTVTVLLHFRPIWG